MKSNKNKKAIGAIISTLLILIVTVVAGNSLYNWYGGFTQNHEAKKLQSVNSNVVDTIEILAFKNESNYNLYIRNHNNGYIIIDKIKLNNIECLMPNGNVLDGSSINIIPVVCDSYTLYSDVALISKIGIINTKIKLK